MSNDIYFGRNSLRFLYFRYKDSPYYTASIIGICVIVSIVLLVQIIIPQLNNWFSIRNEVIATQNKIATVKDNLSYMSTINHTNVDNQLNTAAEALPPEKDFGAILTVLSVSAANAGISLENYSFQLGNIASTSGKLNGSTINGLSSVNVNVVTEGSIDNVQRFIKEVQQKLPLSEITDVEGDTDSVSLTISFYQKAFPKDNADPEQKYPRISDSNNTVLNKLSPWQPNTNIQDIVNTTNGSSSAVPLF